MITNVVKNVTCEAGTNQWREGVSSQLVVRSKLLTKIYVYFSTGCANQVQVQIRKGGAILIPDQAIFKSTPASPYGDYLTGDSQEYWIPVELEIKKSETLEIYYRNLDTTNTHDIMVRFELNVLPTVKSQLRS